MQWRLDYDACDALLGQVHVLLNQVSHGAGMSATCTASVSAISAEEVRWFCSAHHCVVLNGFL